MKSKILTNDEIYREFEGTNFGRMDYRNLLAASVLKKLLGWHCGHTITCIMKKLKLVGKSEKVTKRGIQLLRDEFGDLVKRSG